MRSRESWRFCGSAVQFRRGALVVERDDVLAFLAQHLVEIQCFLCLPEKETIGRMCKIMMLICCFKVWVGCRFLDPQIFKLKYASTISASSAFPCNFPFVTNCPSHVSPFQNLIIPPLLHSHTRRSRPIHPKLHKDNRILSHRSQTPNQPG